MDWLNHHWLAASEAAQKEAESCNPPTEVGPGPKETPVGAGLAGPRSVLTQGKKDPAVLHSDLHSGWTVSLGAWPAVKSQNSSLAFSFTKAGLRNKQQAPAAKILAPFSAQQWVKVEILAVKLLFGHQVSNY